MPIFTTAKSFSQKKVDCMRAELASFMEGSGVVVVYGSYARREASPNSDIDYTFVSLPEASEISGDEIDILQSAVERAVGRGPAEDGAFGGTLRWDDMLKNLGGKHDTNDTITRRVLLLLEGDWLTSSSEFDRLRSKLIEEYIKVTPKNHQIALFLLNDIIRYWRTVTVDYRYKTEEDNKPWAIRNLKLIFSRKLMYAGGLFSVALTVDRSSSDKVKILNELFSMPVIDRLEHICGSANFSNIRKSYGLFLEAMASEDVRTQLNGLQSDERENKTFRCLKNEGHNFTRELLMLFERTFHSTHPIQRAIIF